MAKMPTCPYCGNPVEKDRGIHFKNRYYHKDCYDKKIKAVEEEEERKAKEKAQRAEAKIKNSLPVIKEAVPEEIAVARQKFYEKVKKLAMTEHLDLKIYAVADKLYASYPGMTWEGMTWTLEYYYDFCENVPTANIVGIIPYIYSEAEQVRKQIDSIEPEERSLGDLYKKRTVKINPHRPSRTDIDISKLGE